MILDECKTNACYIGSTPEWPVELGIRLSVINRGHISLITGLSGRWSWHHRPLRSCRLPILRSPPFVPHAAAHGTEQGRRREGGGANCNFMLCWLLTLYATLDLRAKQRDINQRWISQGAVRLMISAADKPADADLVWEKNTVPWLISWWT
jgi:hypothetical protein